MSTHIARHYDGIFDIENKAMVNVERGPQLKIGWPNVVLDAEDCAILPRPCDGDFIDVFNELAVARATEVKHHED
jgi:hypothetical protein